MNPQQTPQTPPANAPQALNAQGGSVIPQNLQLQIPAPMGPAQARAAGQVAYGADATNRAKQVATATAPIPPQRLPGAAAPTPTGATDQSVANYTATLPPNQDTPISTQTTLLISELRDSVVIMKDGSFRAVVACQSINFDLMSATERDAIEYSYQNFFTTFGRGSKVNEVTRINRTTYDTALEELSKRVDSVVSGLFQIGIKAVRLDTRGLSALYYNFNNPDTALREPLVDFSAMATTFVNRAPNPAPGQGPAQSPNAGTATPGGYHV